MNCWICEKIADSREHKTKATILKKYMFDDKKNSRIKITYLDPDKRETEKVRTVAAPSSNLMKYHLNLCTDCNNTRSQPWDNEYENFFTFIIENEVRIKKEMSISLDKDIDPKVLFKYFLKSFGCYIDSTKYDKKNPSIAVPTVIKDSLLNDIQCEESLITVFAVDTSQIHSSLKEMNIICKMNLEKICKNGMDIYCYEESFNWLSIYYYYFQDKHKLRNLIKSHPATWFGKGEKIKLLNKKEWSTFAESYIKKRDWREAKS